MTKLNTFCTIITSNYYPYALALLDSLMAHSSQPVHLQILVTDKEKAEPFLRSLQTANLHFSFPEEITHPLAEKTFQLYHSQHMDAYRWSMKPVFLHYLLETRKYEKVIFLDPDLFFFNDPHFLFDLLDKHRVILTPHWAAVDFPELSLEEFKFNFVFGIYNAGFIGVRNDGTEIMNYWAKLCLMACERNPVKGLFDDQKYLDILHSRFEGIGVVRHRGCNVAEWNQMDCRRTKDARGDVLINDLYPIIFIHFRLPMMVNCLSGVEGLLKDHFIRYAKTVKKYAPDLDLLQLATQQLERDQIAAAKKEKRDRSWFYQLRARLKLRTRIMQWLARKEE